ncbi:MAG: hypothetical protein ABI587_10845 [Gemmatimonadales bacterium]
MNIARCLGMFAALSLACGGGKPPGRVLVRAEQVAEGGRTRLRLIPVAGTRINAQLLPAFERDDGMVFRLDSPDRDADSSYFTSPPSVLLDAPARGTILSSVCPEREAVCLPVEVAVE